MRILFVLEHFHPYIGGVEFLFLQLGKELVRHGQEVTVITTRYDRSLENEEDIEGLKVIRINAQSRYSFSLKAIPAIIKTLKNCDVVHTTTYNAAIPTWIATRIIKKRCIITFHEYWGSLWNQLPYLNPVQRVMYKTFEKIVSQLPFDRVVAVSDYTKNSLSNKGVPKHKLSRIYNGLDYSEFTIESSELEKNKTFIFVGRLGVSKGYDLLLPAIDKFLSHHPEYLFHMVIPRRPVGLFKTINKKIHSLNNRNRIKLFHHLPKEELKQFMMASEFIIVPSYSEGFCFVAAEACALNVPVLHSGRGALKEVVAGRNLSFSPFDEVGLLKGLEDAASAKWDNTPMKKFPIKNTIDAYMQLYLAPIHE